MIDWKRVAELKDEIGADDFDEVVEIFIEEVEEEIEALRAGVVDDELEAKLHLIKGSALNLGFEAFSKLCQHGETAAAAGDFAVIELGKILDCYDQSKSEFLASQAASAAA